jgi:hypothetical protein
MERMMPSATIKIPGQAGIIEARKALLAQAVQVSWNAVKAEPRRQSAGDLGKRLQTARLV